MDTEVRTTEVEEVTSIEVIPAEALVSNEDADSHEEALYQNSLGRWTEALHRDIQTYRSLKRKRWLRPLVYIFVGVLVLVLTSLLKGTWSFWNFPFYLIYLIFAGKELADRSVESRRQAALEVAKAEDPRVINVLALAATEGDYITRIVASNGLKASLAKLKQADTSQISDEGISALLKLLRTQDAELTLAVLVVIKRIAEPRAIPAVNSLITNPVSYLEKRSLKQRLFQTHSTFSPLGERVLDAAHDTLRVLKSHEAKDKLRRTLLRPAAPADKPDESLLRPASSASGVPDEQLLRPAE